MDSALSITAKAAIGALGLAYIDAKHFLSYDLHSLKSLVQTRRLLEKKQRTDRFNNFYYFEEHFSARPNDIFLAFQGEQWTYAGAMKEVLQRANYYIAFGIQKKEIVALNFTNKPGFVFAMLGLWAIGAVPALINYNLADASLLHCIKVSDAKVVFFDEEVEEKMNGINNSLQELHVRAVCCRTGHSGQQNGDLTPSMISAQKLTRPLDSLRSDAKPLDIGALIYTSGSTGLPKAAVVSWTKFTNGANVYSALIGVRQSDRFYTCMPLYHGTACNLGLGTCLLTGATLVLGHRFSNKTFWTEVRASRATIIQYVGEVCRYLMAAPPSPLDRKHCVRAAFGNGMRPDVWEPFRQRFGIDVIAEFYASTEGVGGSLNYNQNPLGAGAVGKSGTLSRVLSKTTSAIIKIDLDTEQEIRASNGLCLMCGEGETGELLYQIDTSLPSRTFTGYYGNTKASVSKLVRDVRVKGDLYMRMGDLMMVKDGYLYFQDRIGDTFRWRGENVSTTEVAEAISTFPGISEANVYGVQVPNHDGRAGCAAIMLDPSTSLNLKGLSKHVVQKLPKYAVPQFLRFVQQMEVTGNHKHQKVALRNHGIDHANMSGDRLLWFKDGQYVDFTKEDLQNFIGGRARL